mgnify:CR=1 FL=1
MLSTEEKKFVVTLTEDEIAFLENAIFHFYAKELKKLYNEAIENENNDEKMEEIERYFTKAEKTYKSIQNKLTHFFK